MAPVGRQHRGAGGVGGQDLVHPLPLDPQEGEVAPLAAAGRVKAGYPASRDGQALVRLGAGG